MGGGARRDEPQRVPQVVVRFVAPQMGGYYIRTRGDARVPWGAFMAKQNAGFCALLYWGGSKERCSLGSGNNPRLAFGEKVVNDGSRVA